MRTWPLALLFSMLLHAAPEPLRYTLRFPTPQTHYVEVEATVPTGGQPQLELFMPVWTPGSYLVREYARNVENLTASASGESLAVEKSTKNRWRIRTNGAAAVVVRYRVYSREMSVRTNWVESGFALLNGAQTFLSLPEKTAREHQVKIELPSEWHRTMTGLNAAPGPASHEYTAPDYDTLVDSPILAGNPAVYEFEVAGKKHYLVNQGEAGVWDGPRSAKDVQKIVETFYRQWGFLPYEKYVFLNLLTEAGGGLEHKNSTVLMTSRWATRTRPAYRNWLGLASHEYFHNWNVKRLRPVELGPFDYEHEVYTRSLWIAEGLTTYYGGLGVRRAGLSKREDYLTSLSASIQALQTTPGRQVVSAEMASFNAWIKEYRPDENSPNTTISYYTKGAVIGFVLDAEIRRLTNNTKSLDDVLKLAYERYAGPHGYTPEQFRQTAIDVAGQDLTAFLHRLLDTTEEVEYGNALQWYGLQFKAPDAPKPDQDEKAWLGERLKTEPNRLIVSQVRRGTPAYTAGINVDDEILALNDFRVRPDNWEKRLADFRPGDQVTLLISRRDQLLRLPATFGKEVPPQYRLEVNPKASDQQKANLSAWLGQ